MIKIINQKEHFLDSSLSYQLQMFSVSIYDLQQHGKFMKETKNL